MIGLILIATWTGSVVAQLREYASPSVPLTLTRTRFIAKLFNEGSLDARTTTVERPFRGGFEQTFLDRLDIGGGTTPTLEFKSSFDPRDGLLRSEDTAVKFAQGFVRLESSSVRNSPNFPFESLEYRGTRSMLRN